MLPIVDNFPHFVDCLLTVNNSGSVNRAEIVELLIKSFNDAMSANCENVDGIVEYYRATTADIELD